MTKIAILLLFVFISCGKIQETVDQRGKTVVFESNPAQAEKYSYEFTTPKCSTDRHSFDTFIKICEALKNESLNNECVPHKRKQLFENEQCPGSFEG